MPYKRSVWVLDIHEYLAHIEASLDRLAYQHTWLGDRSPINQNWHWKDASRVDLEKTQRDALIDWIIEEELSNLFYLSTASHMRSGSTEFMQLHNRLVCEFDLNQFSVAYLIIPKIYSDIHVASFYRQNNWVYLECDIDDNYKQHVIPTTKNFRY